MYQNSERHGGVGRDREHVPDERAAELRPDAHRVRDTATASRPPATAGRYGSAGSMAAQATAKSVIASAKRLIDVRQSCLSSSRIAEISVPAWPMPIHQTKLMMSKRPADRDVVAPDARALQQQLGDRHEAASSTNMNPIARPKNQLYGLVSRQDDRGDLVRDRAERVPRLDDRRRRVEPAGRAVFRIHQCSVVAAASARLGLELRIRVAQRRQIRRPRAAC